jgi:hypothetical protein
MTEDRLKEIDSNIHVVPIFEGEPEHIESADCFCSPTLDFKNPETGVELWIHQRPN